MGFLSIRKSPSPNQSSKVMEDQSSRVMEDPNQSGSKVMEDHMMRDREIRFLSSPALSWSQRKIFRGPFRHGFRWVGGRPGMMSGELRSRGDFKGPDWCQ